MVAALFVTMFFGSGAIVGYWVNLSVPTLISMNVVIAVLVGSGTSVTGFFIIGSSALSSGEHSNRF